MKQMVNYNNHSRGFGYWLKRQWMGLFSQKSQTTGMYRLRYYTMYNTLCTRQSQDRGLHENFILLSQYITLFFARLELVKQYWVIYFNQINSPWLVLWRSVHYKSILLLLLWLIGCILVILNILLINIMVKCSADFWLLVYSLWIKIKHGHRIKLSQDVPFSQEN